MTLGPSVATANAILDAIGNATSYNIAGGVYLKLHDGDPGAAGTANPNTETTRKAVSFGAAASGSMANDAAVSWTNVATTDPEDATHFSLWDALTGGNFVLSGLVTANPLSDGDTITFAIGAFVLSIPVAA